MNTRSLILSALIAGAVLGTFYNLPFLNYVTWPCGLLLCLGGIFSVYLYNNYERKRTQTEEVSASPWQGVEIGALAGLIGAFIGLLMLIITSPLLMPSIRAIAAAVGVDLPSGIWGSEIIVIFLVIIGLVYYPLLGALGGLVAAGVFWKKP